jgi:hypothetical protein
LNQENGKSIYDIITQNIDIPEGLKYRSKYVGGNKQIAKKNSV